MSFITQVILIAIINFFAAFIQAATGFGYALIAMALMPLILPIRSCSSISAIVVLVIAIQMSLTLCRYLDIKKVLIPIGGCLLTIPMGMYFLMHFPELILRVILASLILLLTVFFFYQRKKNMVVKENWYTGATTGLITGISTGMFNIVGPFLLVYYVSICDEMLTFKANMEFSFLIAGITSVILHAVNGNITLEMVPFYVTSALGAISAGFLGLKVFKKINKDWIALIIYVLLPILAIMLLVNS